VHTRRSATGWLRGEQNGYIQTHPHPHPRPRPPHQPRYSVVHVPLIIATHFLFSNLTYWLVGLPPSLPTYTYMFVATLLVNLTSFSFSQLLSTLSPSPSVALALFPITFMFLSNFSGFTILLSNVPTLWSWAPYISFPRWAYEGLVVQAMRDKQPPEYMILLEVSERKTSIRATTELTLLHSPPPCSNKNAPRFAW